VVAPAAAEEEEGAEAEETAAREARELASHSAELLRVSSDASAALAGVKEAISGASSLASLWAAVSESVLEAAGSDALRACGAVGLRRYAAFQLLSVRRDTGEWVDVEVAAPRQGSSLWDAEVGEVAEVAELQALFPDFGVDVLRTALVDAGGDLDVATEALFARAEDESDGATNAGMAGASTDVHSARLVTALDRPAAEQRVGAVHVHRVCPGPLEEGWVQMSGLGRTGASRYAMPRGLSSPPCGLSSPPRADVAGTRWCGWVASSCTPSVRA